jgi:hypothetical protein
MAEHYWRIKRARLFESKILNTNLDFPALNAAHRLMSSAERGFHKALKTLREMQKQRGFVPQRKTADSQSNAEFGSAASGAAIGIESEDHDGFEPQTSSIDLPQPPTADDLEVTEEEYAAYMEDRRARSQAFLREYAASGKLSGDPLEQAVKDYVADMQ